MGGVKRLTGFIYDWFEMGQKAVRLLTEIIDSDDENSRIRTDEILQEPEFVPGDTVRAISE